MIGLANSLGQLYKATQSMGNTIVSIKDTILTTRLPRLGVNWVSSSTPSFICGHQTQCLENPSLQSISTIPAEVFFSRARHAIFDLCKISSSLHSPIADFYSHQITQSPDLHLCTVIALRGLTDIRAGCSFHRLQ